jgi:hypothetical protein
MMKLLDVVIRLGDAREVSRPEIPNGKRPFEKSFGSGNTNFQSGITSLRKKARGDRSENQPP